MADLAYVLAHAQLNPTEQAGELRLYTMVRFIRTDDDVGSADLLGTKAIETEILVGDDQATVRSKVDAATVAFGQERGWSITTPVWL